MDFGRGVTRDAPGEHIDEDADRQHVTSLQGAHEPGHAEEQDHEADRPKLDASSHAHLFILLIVKSYIEVYRDQQFRGQGGDRQKWVLVE